jgi:hypothetical protein
MSDWSISFVASYLIAQSFCISIDQWVNPYKVVLHSITARFCLRSYYSAIWLPFWLFFKHLSRDFEKTTITAMYQCRALWHPTAPASWKKAVGWQKNLGLVFCIHKNDAELFFNVWHQLTKFSETGWPRGACNFMFPLRSRRNAIHRNSSRLSPSELVFWFKNVYIWSAFVLCMMSGQLISDFVR